MLDEPVRVKDVTSTHEPASQIVYVRGLTRPFTLPQLKELLGRYGALVEGQFWLDKIKSQCFVTVRIFPSFLKSFDEFRFSITHWKKHKMLVKHLMVVDGHRLIPKLYLSDLVDKMKYVSM
jgi:hypothetical protein